MTTAEFEEQVEEAANQVRIRLEVVNLTEQEKGIIVGAYRQGWIDGWLACAEKDGKTDVAYLIQDAISHFANVCPWCDRDLDLFLNEEQINIWLEGEDDPA